MQSFLGERWPVEQSALLGLGALNTLPLGGLARLFALWHYSAAGSVNSSAAALRCSSAAAPFKKWSKYRDTLAPFCLCLVIQVDNYCAGFFHKWRGGNERIFISEINSINKHA